MELFFTFLTFLLSAYLSIHKSLGCQMLPTLCCVAVAPIVSNVENVFTIGQLLCHKTFDSKVSCF